MRRILLGILIGLLAFGAGAAGAKVVNVTNPMTEPLDGGGQSIYNISSLLTSGSVRLAQTGAISGPLIFQAGPGGSQVAIFGGDHDPNAGNGEAAPAGSMYLEFGATPGWFYKSGAENTSWLRASP